MLKRLFLIVLTSFACLQGQEIAEKVTDLAFQELVYDMGMNLADQHLVVDGPTLKKALVCLYEDVQQVTQIIDLFLIIDEELVEQNITTIDQLVDYEIATHPYVVESAITWLSAYQKLFMIFMALHPQDASFETWCNDIEFISSLQDDEEPADPGYVIFWQASYAVMQAQADFEDTLRDIA